MKRGDMFAVLLLLAVTAAFYLPLFQNLNHGLSSVDWYEKYCFMSSARKTVLEYRQFPFRSPFFDGGYPTIGHPYDDVFNPLFILVLAFGEVVAIRVIPFLLFLSGALGMFYLARYVLAYNLPGALFSAATFVLSSFGACQFSEGNLEKLYPYLLPLLTAFFLKSKKNPYFILAASLVLGMFLVKGVIAIPVVLFLFLIACLYSVEAGEGKPGIGFSYMIAFLVVVCLSCALCAPKILSALDLLGHRQIQFIHFPFENSYQAISSYIVQHGRALSLARLFSTLLVKDAYVVDGDDFSQMYLGYIPVALFLVAAFLYCRKLWRFLAALAVFMLIAAGPRSPVDIFKLLWQSHPFAHFIWKLDEAFHIYILFLICTVSGAAFLLLDRAKKHRQLWVLAAYVLLSLASVHLFLTDQRFLFHSDVRLLEPQFGQNIPRIPRFYPRKPFFQVKFNFPDKTKDDYFYVRQNIGITDFHQDLLIRIGNYAIPKYVVDKGDYRRLPGLESTLTLNPEYKGEAFFPDGRNKALLKYFSPNKIRVNVTVAGPATLIINQNYHKNWKASLGRVENYHGLLAVRLRQPGEYEISLTYFPVEFYIGLIISAAGLACFLAFLAFGRPHQSY